MQPLFLAAAVVVALRVFGLLPAVRQSRAGSVWTSVVCGIVLSVGYLMSPLVIVPVPMVMVLWLELGWSLSLGFAYQDYLAVRASRSTTNEPPSEQLVVTLPALAVLFPALIVVVGLAAFSINGDVSNAPPELQSRLLLIPWVVTGAASILLGVPLIAVWAVRSRLPWYPTQSAIARAALARGARRQELLGSAVELEPRHV